jgi:hypothetical protein
MGGSGGPHDCPEILQFEAISGPLPGRAMAETGDGSLGDLPVDVGDGLGDDLLSIRRVEFM